MKSAAWMNGLFLMALGGCSTHTPVVVSPPLGLGQNIAIPPPTKETNATLDDTVCCILPQDLELELPQYGPKIDDVERFEQSMIPYVEHNGVDRMELLEAQRGFEKRYFTPWSYVVPPHKLEEVSWPLRAYRGGYGSNLKPLRPQWFEEIRELSNFEQYGTISKKAITLKWMDIRAFPSAKPLYKDPSLPGEGYPFDLLQNSSVNYNEPIFLSHTSKDGAWSYIFTNNASGWVPSDGVATIEDHAVQTIQKAPKVFITEDNIALYDNANRFVAYSRVGMVMALEKEEGEYYHLMGIDTNNTRKTLSLPKRSGRIGVSPFTKNDMILIGTQMLNNTYGWGGMYGERDCSSMIRDFMTPFGIWLPRNSSAQARRGEVISLKGLDDDQKLSLIKEKGVPFETILYLKGHVLLYAGTYQESVMALHNIWGVRTLDGEGKKGRHVVGGAVISTLELGSNLKDFDPEMKLLRRLESMNIITRTPQKLTRQNKSVSRL
jgi:cell wall-associated NlpC family hydrolase